MIKNKKTLHRRIVFGLCVALAFNLLCLIIWGLGYLKPSIQKVYDDSKLLKNEIVSQEYNSLEELISILDENKINYSIINFNNELIKESEKEHTDLLFISDLITVGNEHYLVKGYFKHYSTGGETFFDFFKIQLILLVIILGVVYLFSNKTIVNPISKLIDDMKNYKYGRKPTRNKVNSDIDLIQNEFVNLTEALDKNDEEKNRIIASISHDIKTPLTSIIGYSDLIKNEKDLKTIKKYNDIINNFQDKFIDVARLYYKKTGKELSFVPMYNAVRLKKVVFGKPIKYDPNIPMDIQRDNICEYLKKEITMLAKELPRHKVVPYANIKRRKQHYSK